MKINKELIKNITNADNAEQYVDAHEKFALSIAEEIVAEARNAVDETLDEKIMDQRNLRYLTAEEIKFYNELSADTTLKGVEKMMPITIIDRVFEDLEKNYPLLKEIQFMNVTGLTKFYVRKTDAEGAEWGELNSEISKKLDSVFETVDVLQKKLSAFVPVSKDMLRLGPVWIDKYVRTILAEAISKALEQAIINGDGVKCPVGMLKNIEGDFNSSSGYPDREAVSITDLSPETLGDKVMKPLLKDRADMAPNIIFVVNPADYWSKVFPATTVMSAAGQYVFNVLPVNARVVQSSAMPVGKMLACIPKDYFMGVAMNSIIESSDQFQFLQDRRVYMTVMLANGTPVNAKSFITLDISGLKTEAPKVLKSK